jgi:hypothetical protein
MNIEDETKLIDELQQKLKIWWDNANSTDKKKLITSEDVVIGDYVIFSPSNGDRAFIGAKKQTPDILPLQTPDILTLLDCGQPDNQQDFLNCIEKKLHNITNVSDSSNITGDNTNFYKNIGTVPGGRRRKYSRKSKSKPKSRRNRKSYKSRKSNRRR